MVVLGLILPCPALLSSAHSIPSLHFQFCVFTCSFIFPSLLDIVVSLINRSCTFILFLLFLFLCFSPSLFSSVQVDDVSFFNSFFRLPFQQASPGHNNKSDSAKYLHLQWLCSWCDFRQEVLSAVIVRSSIQGLKTLDLGPPTFWFQNCGRQQPAHDTP